MNNNLIRTKKMVRFRDRLLNYKIYIGRSMNYLTIINSGMLLFIVLSKLKEGGYIETNLSSIVIPSFIAGILLLAVLGWIDIKLLKGYSSEVRMVFDLNPHFSDMKNKIDKIFERMGLGGRNEKKKDN